MPNSSSGARQHVELLERALVEQQLDALARGQFPAGVLRLDALLAAAELGAGAPFFEGIKDVFHVAPARISYPRICRVLTRQFPNRKTGVLSDQPLKKHDFQGGCRWTERQTEQTGAPPAGCGRCSGWRD